MELYLIRHGQSANNATEPLGPRVCDPPLTDVGQQQVRLVSQHLASSGWPGPAANGDRSSLTRLYSSPMLRALQTAEAICQAIGLAVHVRTDIHEIGGIWLDHDDKRGPVGLAGLKRGQIAERFPHAVLPVSIGDDGWWNRPPEDHESGSRRARRFAGELIEQASSDDRIALVTHGDYGDSLICALLGMPYASRIRFTQHNTAVSCLDVTPDAVRLRFLNRVDHLPREMVT